ncbi:MAG: helix-turn-helix domain-containing protein [Treponema sp.]|nr:helix-turn-helix domain-containing protein [Treponema sp.]
MKEKEDIIARFIKIRKEFGPTQEKFGKRLGFSDGSISLIEAGKTSINEKHIKLISGVLGISEEWLRSGEGETYKDGKAPSEDAMLEMFRALSPEGRRLVLDYVNVVLKNEKAMQGKVVQEKGDIHPEGLRDAG